MEKAMIIDLDDTLLNSKPIQHLLPRNGTREEWDNFSKHYPRCKINENIAEMVKTLALSDIKPIFITSREDCLRSREDSIVSIILALGFGVMTKSLLLMREYCDYRSSDEVKLDLYNKYVKDKYNVLFALDDEQTNARMWKSVGIESLLRI